MDGPLTFTDLFDLEELAQAEAKENERASAAFEYYYRLGARRSIIGTAEHFGISYPTVMTWAKAFKWRARATARDRQESEAIANERIKAITEMKKRLILQGNELQELGLVHLKNKAKIRGRGGLNDVVAIQMVQTGMQAELRGYDLPDRITRQEQTGEGGGPVQMEQVNQARDRLVELIERHVEALNQAPPELPAPAESEE